VSKGNSKVKKRNARGGDHIGGTFEIDEGEGGFLRGISRRAIWETYSEH